MEKVKRKYEEQIISLKNTIDKYKSKTNSCENIIRSIFNFFSFIKAIFPDKGIYLYYKRIEPPQNEF